jgi:hypothetical protein
MGLVVVALVVCLAEAFLKGWFSLLLLPASLVVLPLEFFLQRQGVRTQKRLDSGYLRALRLAQLVALVMTYASLVGFGDTDDVLLFGFKADVLDSKLTNLSWTIFGLASAALAVLTIWLVVALVRRRREKVAAPA